ncbi:DUF4232 domain-containing protein [Streptacidiphilus sp. PAMC 29251]
MTGPSDDEEQTPGAPDPLDALLRPSTQYLPVPPGSFERTWRTSVRRRRAKAAVGGGLAVAVVAGALYLVGPLSPTGSTVVVTPPASSGRLAPGPSGTSPTPSPSRTTPAPGTGSPSAGTPGQTSGSPSATGSRGSGSTGTVGSTPMCATSQLTASLGGGDAGAGNLYRYLVLTNHSRTTCHVTGYPGLSLLNAAGKLIGVPATEQSLAHSPVVLHPGASASDTIHTVNKQGTSSTECLPTSVDLRIYPPGNKDSLVFPGQVTNCDNEFSVTPFTAGTTGNPSN